jgi:uncharacterized DUF497 family protein
MYGDGVSMFHWDEANISHIARHKVTPEEVEQAVANASVEVATTIRGGETRIVCAGPTDAGRVLKVVYTVRAGRVRVVTAHEDRRLRRLV